MAASRIPAGSSSRRVAGWRPPGLEPGHPAGSSPVGATPAASPRRVSRAHLAGRSRRSPDGRCLSRQRRPTPTAGPLLCQEAPSGICVVAPLRQPHHRGELREVPPIGGDGQRARGHARREARGGTRRSPSERWSVPRMRGWSPMPSRSAPLRTRRRGGAPPRWPGPRRRRPLLRAWRPAPRRVLAVERPRFGEGSTILDALAHVEMEVGVGGDLGKVGDADHLVIGGEGAQPLAQRAGIPTANTRRRPRRR